MQKLLKKNDINESWHEIGSNKLFKGLCLVAITSLMHTSNDEVILKLFKMPKDAKLGFFIVVTKSTSI